MGRPWPRTTALFLNGWVLLRTASNADTISRQSAKPTVSRTSAIFKAKRGVAFTCTVFSQQDNCWLTLVCQYSRLKGGVAFTSIVFSQQDNCWLTLVCQYSRLKGGVAFTCIVFSQQDNCWLTLVCQYSRLKGSMAFTCIVFSQQDNCWLTLVCQYSRLKGGMAFTCIVFSQQDNCWLTLVCQYSRLKGVWPLPVSYFHSRITVDWLLFVNIQGWKGGVAFTCIIFSQQDNCWLTLVCHFM